LCATHQEKPSDVEYSKSDVVCTRNSYYTPAPIARTNDNGMASLVKHVLIIKSNLEPFRAAFYAQLEKTLESSGVQLQVAIPRQRCGSYSGSWLLPVATFDFTFMGRSACWQSVSQNAKQSDLVVVQQSARELTNYSLLLGRDRAHYRLALWGHGTEFQRRWTSPLTEVLKNRLFKSVDYWFAYTPKVASLVARNGFPEERITTVWNSIDTNTERQLINQVTKESCSDLRLELGIPETARIACYCGSLYKAKRLDFLIKAFELVRQDVPDAHLLILGDGSERDQISRMAVGQHWLHVVGPVFGLRKAIMLGTSDCMVIPGVVGLAIVDAFVHQCPLVTTDIPGHGPEIEYLHNGLNGIMVANDVQSFARAITALLTDATHRRVLVEGCRETASHLTLDNMVNNFAAGVMRALSLPRRATAH
jgi:glycosyltransferase involved in cell wall biosynthesis